RNMFAFLGGVPEITVIRNDRLRCQGAFAHPILAGCFWATLMPLMAAFRFGSTNRAAPWTAGLVCSLVIVINCASSTPVAAVMFGTVALLVFPSRQLPPLFRVGIVLALCGIHMAMKAPVWHLVARIDLAGGSTGWHWYFL